MSKTDRLSREAGWIDLSFVERKRTPPAIIQKTIRHHLAGLSIVYTIILLEDFGIKRSRIASHNWIQKAALESDAGLSRDYAALYRTVVRVNDEQYWLYATVDSETNRFPHTRLFPTYTIPITQEFLPNPSINTMLTTQCFSPTSPGISKAPSAEPGSNIGLNAMGGGTRLNVYSKR